LPIALLDAQLDSRQLGSALEQACEEMPIPGLWPAHVVALTKIASARSPYQSTTISGGQ
jgi:hypothetical protein